MTSHDQHMTSHERLMTSHELHDTRREKQQQQMQQCRHTLEAGFCGSLPAGLAVPLAGALEASVLPLQVVFLVLAMVDAFGWRGEKNCEHLDEFYFSP